MEFQCRVIVQRRCTSCCSSVENIPLQAERHSARRQKPFAFPPESAFTFRPECCSESQRNRVRLQSGIAFTFDRIPQVPTIHSCLALFVCLFISAIPSILHWGWLRLIHRSEEFDKELWVRYRKEARLLLLGNTKLPDDLEDFQPRTTSKQWQWLLLEVGVTFALSLVFFSLVLWRNV
jgi:hypothetical protein